MNLIRKCICVCFICVMMLTNAYASDNINAVLNDTALYVYENTKNPQISSVGGEWAVIGTVRSGVKIPSEFYTNYYNNTKEYVKEHNGALHKKKYTEYSRVILALTAIGKNPSDVSGFNLLMPLGDYEKTIWQGINGAIWALIALDCGDYEIPHNPQAEVQATREMYIDYILQNQQQDGGWALSGDESDIDVTAMAVQALSKYTDTDSVNISVQKALDFISSNQKDNGGFKSRGEENSESSAQVLTALCQMGISPDDARFTKNGNTVFDNLLSYRCANNGFKHIKTQTEPDKMATEQALYALASLKRFNEGKSGLYTMDDVSADSFLTDKKEVLETSDKEDVVYPDKTFDDIENSIYRTEIEYLAQRGIINGKGDSCFEPYSTMTRAEFAAIIVRGMELGEKSGSKFSDVKPDDWFYSVINTASAYGIINGVSPTEFNPYGEINRQEAAVMVTRAARLCGVKTQIDTVSSRDILAAFYDYVTAAEWAAPSLAFCYENGILSDTVEEIKPYECVCREEVAKMVYELKRIQE